MGIKKHWKQNKKEKENKHLFSSPNKSKKSIHQPLKH